MKIMDLKSFKSAQNLNKFDKLLNIKTAIEDLTKNVMVDVSAEERIIGHYEKMLKYIRQKIKGAIDNPKDMDLVYNEVKMVKAELSVLIEKIKKPEDNKNLKRLYGYVNMLMKRFFSKQEAQEKVEQDVSIPSKMASLISAIKYKNASINDILDGNTRKEIIENYAEKICEALKNIHPNVIYQIDNDFSTITIFLVQETDIPMLSIYINDNLLIDAIKPHSTISEIYPYHSLEFYQKYWKPIVEKVGHYYLPNTSLLMLSDSLPDIPNKSVKKQVEVWNVDRRCSELLDILFDSDNNLWSFNPTTIKTASSKTYNEKDFFNAIVKCIDDRLESIYNRTGTVIQIIPHVDFIELDVDFGRGIGIVRLTNKQVRIVRI